MTAQIQFNKDLQWVNVSNSNFCQKHHLFENVVVRVTGGPQIMCQECFRNQYVKNPHIILNDASKQFFQEYSQCIIEHYSSIIQSHKTQDPLPIFRFTPYLDRRVLSITKINLIEELLRNQIEVHNGNINFVHNASNNNQLINPYFMNDLLNYYHESAIEDISSLINYLRKNMQDAGIVVNNDEIFFDEKLVESLMGAKNQIKLKYQDRVQVKIINTKNQNFKQSMKIAIPEKQDNECSEDYLTPRREPVVQIKPFQLKTEKKTDKNQKQIVPQENQWTQVIQINESHFAKELQDLISRLQTENINLKSWKNQMQNYLNQMTLKIEQLTPRGYHSPQNHEYIPSVLPIQRSSINEFKTIKKLQDKIIELEVIAKGQEQENKKLNQTISIYKNKLQQYKQQFREKQDMLIEAQNSFAYKIREIERFYGEQRETNKLFCEKMKTDNNRLLKQLNSKNQLIHEILGENQNFKHEKNELLKQIISLKQELQKQRQQTKQEQTINQTRQIFKKQRLEEQMRSSSHHSVEHIANQIKQKMNKINSLIRISSMPQLRKNKSKAFKVRHLNEISTKSPPCKVSQDKENIFADLNNEIELKNREIQELNEANLELKRLSKQLQQQIAEFQGNERENINLLRQKIRETEDQLIKISAEKKQSQLQIISLRKQVEEISEIKQNMNDHLENKEAIIEKLNFKVKGLEETLYQLKKNSNNEQINDELLQEVVIFEAENHKKKKIIQKMIQYCKQIIVELQNQNQPKLQLSIKDLHNVIEIGTL